MYKVRKINFGWYRRKHGILLENLPPLKQKLLLHHNHMKWLDSDTQAFEVIFKVEDQISHERSLSKIYWNPYKEDFTEYKEIEKDSDTVEWNCAICNTEILSKMNYKKIENFICNKCQDAYNSSNRNIDQRIVDSSNEFIKHCKKILKREQKEFMKFTKKSIKGSNNLER